MSTTRMNGMRWRLLPTALLVVAGAACASAPERVVTAEPVTPPITEPPAADADPRVGLAAGWKDAGEASWNLDLVAHVDRPEGFYDPNALGNLLLGNTDLAFQGNIAYVGSFHGWNAYDISSPSAPRLVKSFVCPGGQGDLSIWGDLLFMSVEMPNARVDCGTVPPQGRVSPDRFLGVRVFDISDLQNPRQVAAVQTCRGSHTHTLVSDPNDASNVYIYVSGAAGVRPAEELQGCIGGEDPQSALFRIEVIRVPVNAPQQAAVVSTPRIFADPATGEIAGLWQGGASGAGTQQTAQTNQCHDITSYPAIGLAAGACAGNGLLLDIEDADAPTRTDEVFDPNFAYWHSATFDDMGTKVIYTDEWGGGSQARCRESDDPRWGANAIFRVQGEELVPVGYYKLPAPQSAQENCVAHNGSLIPVPGRDIMVQAWYQGGVSVFDFTDPENPYEIAYFDRGPLSDRQLLLGGYWSTYWYNGRIYGSEIGRGLDVFRLTPSEYLTQNEIAAAELVRMQRFNPQHQTPFDWPADPAVARALIDQLQRSDAVPDAAVADLRSRVDAALAATGQARGTAFAGAEGSVAGMLANVQAPAERRQLEMLRDVLAELRG